MYPDRDFDVEQDLPPGHEDLSQDLDLPCLWEAMAAGDERLSEIARQALLSGSADPEVIAYRQQVLADCLVRPSAIREMHALTVAAVEGWRHHHLYFVGRAPDSILSTSIRALNLVLPLLRRVTETANAERDVFRSPGLTRLLALIAAELGDDYLLMLEDHVRRLRFRHGVLLSARLGDGNIGTEYTVRLPHRYRWWQFFPLRNRRHLRFEISTLEDDKVRELSRIRERGLNPVANVLARSSNSLFAFLRSLEVELGFYVGCLNLHERLAEDAQPTCLPQPLPVGKAEFSASGLYDICLALRTHRHLVGNAINGEGRRLVLITGANGGGKSTFLRSVGQAQVMMQAGMFVAAQSLRAGTAPGIFTHFKRGEDASMEKGKLEEELSRLDAVAGSIAPGGVLLCNESFSSTNEREASELAHQVVRALTESGVRVFYVTHLNHLAQQLYGVRAPDVLFLRAERRPDGSRSFKLEEAEPLPTSFGEDLYLRVFGTPKGTPLPDSGES
jgi:hypothetical protein